MSLRTRLDGNELLMLAAECVELTQGVPAGQAAPLVANKLRAAFQSDTMPPVFPTSAAGEGAVRPLRSGEIVASPECGFEGCTRPPCLMAARGGSWWPSCAQHMREP